MRKKYPGVYGCYIGCKPTDSGMVRCTCEYDEITPGHGRPYLGKRVDVNTTSKSFQKIFRKQERLWNNAITKNTDAAWEAWYRA